MAETAKLKTITLPHREFSRIDNGGDLLEIKVSNGADRTQTFDLLFNRDLLLRIEKKRSNRSRSRFINQNFINGISSIKNLVSPNQYSKIKQIIVHNTFLKDRVATNIRGGKLEIEKFNDLMSIIARRWSIIEQLQSPFSLNLLRVSRYGYCGTCHALREGESLSNFPGMRVKPSKIPVCRVCGKDITEKKPVKTIPDAIHDYLSGTWFEDYVAARLARLGWKVWPQVYIFGNSGAKFEIDILAIKDGISMVVECKTGSMALQDVTTFVAKYYDINTNIGAFISLQPSSSDAKTLTKKNYSLRLIDDFRSEKQLMKYLKKLPQ